MNIKNLVSPRNIGKKYRRIKIKYYNFRKNYSASEKHIRINSAQNINDFSSDFELSEALMLQGQHEEAARLLNRLAKVSALNTDNPSYKALNTRAKIKLAENEYNRLNLTSALAHLDSVDYMPNGHSYFSHKELSARIHKYNADYQKAFDNYKAIVDLDYKEIARVYSGYFEAARILDPTFIPEEYLKVAHGLENEHYSSLALAKYYVTRMNSVKTLEFLENLNPKGAEYYSIKAEINYYEGNYLDARKDFLQGWRLSKSNIDELGKSILAFINENNNVLSKSLPNILIKIPLVKRKEVVYRKLVMMNKDINKVFQSYDNTAGIKGLQESMPDKLVSTILDGRLQNTSLLVLPMWGIGDEIMIAGVYQELFDLLSKRNVAITIGTEQRLLSLMQRSFPDIEFRVINRKHRGPHVNKLSNAEIDSGEVLPNHKLYYTLDYPTWKDKDQYDYVIPVPFVIKNLKKTQADFPGMGDYLVADGQLTAKIKQRLDEVSNKPKVGISWRSGFTLHNRSIYYTSVKQWSEIFRHADKVDFVNLQYDNCDAELDYVESEFGVKVINFKDIDLFNDFETVCALISSLQLTIAPCTVMGDLAGALGVKTLYMINSPEGNWRFRESGNNDIWFKSIEFMIPDQFGDTNSLLKNTSMAFSKEIQHLTSASQGAN